MRAVCFVIVILLTLTHVLARHPHLGDVRTFESEPIQPSRALMHRLRAKRALLRSHWHGRHTDYSLESGEHKIIRRIW